MGSYFSAFRFLTLSRIVGIFLLAIGVFGVSSSAMADEDRVFTLWPLVDYRYSEAVDYTNLNLFGPIFNYERKGSEREYGFRPFYFRARDESGSSYAEYLYPVASRKSSPGASFFQGLHLFNYDFGEPEKQKENEFMIFPILFYGQTEEKGNYFAIFPLGGTIFDKFGRDEIHFTLFPLYGRTMRDGTSTTNILWPIFARIRGEGEKGYKFWPLYGTASKEGVYRKKFYLWPIFFNEDLRLDTNNPLHKRVAFPFYVSQESPERSKHTYLWPFFSHLEDRRKDYEEWNFPWPLFRVARGEYQQSTRFLPLFADERRGANRKRWFLWPIYKIEDMETEVLSRRRHRVLFFLFSNLEEKVHDEEGLRKKRVALWPLFTYERKKGVSHLSVLSILEPFFPDNEGIERNWSPLWRIYQSKWDKQGNSISSFLWNLYWKERRGADLAMEIFPLVSYRREKGRGVEVSLIKGLLTFRSAPEENQLSLFYLPWPLRWSTGG